MYCDQCGSEIYDGELYCSNCGAPAPLYSVPPRNNQSVNRQQVYSQPIKVKPPYNGLANASFYVGMASLLLCWVPILDMCLVGAGMALSILALVKIKKERNNWKPIAGLVFVGISLIVSIGTIL